MRRSPRLLLPVVLLSALGLTALTGCGGDPAGTTCGDVAAMSADDRFDLARDLTEEAGGNVDRMDDATDAQRAQVADAVAAECDGEDDDTTIGDVDHFDVN